MCNCGGARKRQIPKINTQSVPTQSAGTNQILITQLQQQQQLNQTIQEQMNNTSVRTAIFRQYQTPKTYR